MKEMIKKYKGTLICSVLVMLAGILVGFTMAQSIWINVFFVVTDCILVTIIFYDNRNRQQSSKVIGMVIWMIPVTALIYNGMARLISMDADSENLFMAVIYFGTGLLFMIIGNYLPKVKQNNTIGIRVVWTLQDEENWSATHRFSGKLWVASGVLCMFCGLFGESIAAFFDLGENNHPEYLSMRDAYRISIVHGISYRLAIFWSAAKKSSFP